MSADEPHSFRSGLRKNAMEIPVASRQELKSWVYSALFLLKLKSLWNPVKSLPRSLQNPAWGKPPPPQVLQHACWDSYLLGRCKQNAFDLLNWPFISSGGREFPRSHKKYRFFFELSSCPNSWRSEFQDVKKPETPPPPLYVNSEAVFQTVGIQWYLGTQPLWTSPNLVLNTFWHENIVPVLIVCLVHNAQAATCPCRLPGDSPRYSLWGKKICLVFIVLDTHCSLPEPTDDEYRGTPVWELKRPWTKDACILLATKQHGFLLWLETKKK